MKILKYGKAHFLNLQLRIEQEIGAKEQEIGATNWRAASHAAHISWQV